MKLRIKGPSLRLRLTQKEVGALAAGAVVEERVPFAGGAELTYRLRRDAQAPEPRAEFAGNVLEVLLPEAQARDWCASDRVTLAHRQGVPGGGALELTIEKDFACLAPRAGEDESDHYPHPGAGAGQRC